MSAASRFLAIGGLLATTAAAPLASSAVIIKDPHPPEYKVEIEPHLNVQYFFDEFGAHGFGPGARFGIPILSPGFIKKLNNSIAISFGPDLLYYRPWRQICGRDGCYDRDTFWALYVPVTMQWNFWITEKWSAFGEPGLVARTPIGTCNQLNGCRKDSFVWPSFYAGARFHFSERMALTMRIGYPNGVSVGVSFF